MFKITAVNDSPTLMVIMEGRNVLTQANRVELIVEENAVTNIAYKDLDIIVFAYDPDAQDVLTIEIQDPLHGIATEPAEVKKIIFIEQDCSMPWNDNYMPWDTAVAEIKSAPPTVTIPKPCGADSELFTGKHVWTATVITYKPNNNYFGSDIIKVQTLMYFYSNI